MMSNPVIIYTTWPDHARATAAARHLVASKNASCINILHGMTSVYEWEGKTEEVQEIVMLIKTSSGHIPALESLIHEIHPYDTVAFLVLPVIYTAPKYQSWLLETLSGAQPPEGRGS